MTGTLLVSLDCEGRWGMADHDEMLGEHPISDTNIRLAYDFLFETLERLDIRGTFAVVGLFMAGKNEAEEYIHQVSTDPVSRRWLTKPQEAIKAGQTDGWFFEDLPNLVLKSGKHELASHGYSHMPFASEEFTSVNAHRELNAMRDLASRKGWNIQSMVFPRNQIAYTDLLGEYGIQKYRSSQENHSLVGRASSLVSEFNIFAQSDDPPPSNNTVSAGRFLNWRSGPRRLVPTRITVRRWKSILNDAVAHNRCAHLWFHPHNLITGTAQRELVANVLELAGASVKTGDLNSTTFSEIR